ncbi:MAG TPA: hypothetical protein VGK58_06560 [Lacipirellulaceae bacterium]
MSPGGHYLAIANSQAGRVGMIDARNGAIAGDLMIPTSLRERARCHALSFSADGAKLWSLLKSGAQYRLMAWNLVDGKTTVDTELDEAAARQIDRVPGSGYKNVPDIIEFPSAAGVLIHGSLLVDSANGSLVWNYGAGSTTQNPSILRLVGGNQMLTLNGHVPSARLSLVPIPFERIAANRKTISAGGTAQDEGLPPVRVPKWDGIERHRGVVSAQGRYKPRPVITHSTIDDPFSLQPLDDQAGGYDTQHFALSDLQKPRCAALFRAAMDEDRGFSTTSLTAIDIFDLSNGERESRLEVPRAVAPLDISEDGSRALIASTDDWRIDIWDIKTGSHQLGFRPAGPRKGRTYSRQMLLPAFPFAQLIGNDQLLTADPAGEVILWALEELAPLYSLATRGSSRIALDPSRTCVILQDESGIKVCEVKSGASVAELSRERVPAEFILAAASFRSDGESVALLIQSTAGQRLLVWNITSDMIECNMQLPFIARDLAWSGDDVLLGWVLPLDYYRRMPDAYDFRRGDSSMPDYVRRAPQISTVWRPTHQKQSIIRVSPREQRVIWTYEGGNIRLLGQTAVDRAWIAVPSQSGVTLTSMAGRSAKEAEAIEKNPQQEERLLRGEKFKLDVDVGPLPDVILRARERRDEMTKSLESVLKQRLGNYTLSTSVKEPLHLRASILERRAGDLLAPDGKMLLAATPGFSRVSQMGPGAAGVLARLEIQAENEQEPIWLAEAWFANSLAGAQQGRDADVTLQYLLPWERAIRWLEKEPLPTNTVDPSRFGGVGKTELIP